MRKDWLPVNMRMPISCILAMALCFSASLLWASAASAKKTTDRTAPGRVASRDTATPDSSPAVQKNEIPPASSRTVPTTIQAERMEYDADRQTVIFTSKVHVQRPDFELWSEKMTVFLKKNKSKERSAEDSTASGMAAGDIDRLVAEKNVRFKREEKEGTCQKATYYADAGKIILDGSPVLKDKDTLIKGKQIIHSLKENKTDVAGDNRENASVTFQAPDNSGKEGGLPSFGPKGK